MTLHTAQQKFQVKKLKVETMEELLQQDIGTVQKVVAHGIKQIVLDLINFLAVRMIVVFQAKISLPDL